MRDVQNHRGKLSRTKSSIQQEVKRGQKSEEKYESQFFHSKTTEKDFHISTFYIIFLYKRPCKYRTRRCAIVVENIPANSSLNILFDQHELSILWALTNNLIQTNSLLMLKSQKVMISSHCRMQAGDQKFERLKPHKQS